MSTATALEAINILLAGTRLLNELGINYREILQAQAEAGEDGLSQEQILEFLAQSQDAIDEL